MLLLLFNGTVIYLGLCEEIIRDCSLVSRTIDCSLNEDVSRDCLPLEVIV